MGAELTLRGHQLSNPLTAVFEGLRDGVDLYEPTARSRDVGAAGADVHGRRCQPIEWTTELARLHQRVNRAGVTTEEVHILRGIARQVQKRRRERP